MDQISDGKVTSRGWNDAQRAAVVEEMNRVLAHSAFKTSKRCVELLRYLVHHALDGEEDGIKERTLGIEVFGRSANYDTNVDPIVRRTANEIRKRLAQCYVEPDYQTAVRIRLDQGSYLPEFVFAGEVRILGAIEAEKPEESPEPLKRHRSEATPFARSSGASSRVPCSKWIWLLGVVAAALVSAACLLLFGINAFSSPEYRVWKPLIDSRDQITVCLSDRTPLISSGGKVGSQTINSMNDFLQTSPTFILHGPTQDTAFIDAHVSHAISTLLLGFKRKTLLQPSSALTFQDFRQRPTVLIGGTNNPWTLILLSKLRYGIRTDPVTQDKWIQDARNPSMHDWKIEGKPQSTDTYFDYAVITRFFNRDTGQWIMALSGLEKHGTEAAGELVADPAFAKFIPPSVRSKGNFQIVLRTSVMRENTGPIEVLAVYTW